VQAGHWAFLASALSGVTYVPGLLRHPCTRSAPVYGSGRCSGGEARLLWRGAARFAALRVLRRQSRSFPRAHQSPARRRNEVSPIQDSRTRVRSANHGQRGRGKLRGGASRRVRVASRMAAATAVSAFVVKPQRRTPRLAKDFGGAVRSGGVAVAARRGCWGGMRRGARPCARCDASRALRALARPPIDAETKGAHSSWDHACKATNHSHRGERGSDASQVFA
jgi:hypothetical protein